MSEIIISNHNSISVQHKVTEDMYNRFVSFIDAKPKTLESYKRALKQLFKYFTSEGISQPTREDILSYRDMLIATGHKPTTVQNYITTTRLFFQWLEQEGIYPNIAIHIKGAKLDREHKKDYFTSSQVRSILKGINRESVSGKRDFAMMALMVTGGLRTIEVSRANIEDIRTAGDNTVLYVQGKGRDEKTEYIILDENVESAIRAYLADRTITSSAEPLFCSESNNSKGQRMTTRAISGIAKACMQKAGFDSDKLTAHSLRHTAVTLSLLAGETLQEVQQFARHANIATTMIYNHAIDKAKNTCSRSVAKAIF